MSKPNLKTRLAALERPRPALEFLPLDALTADPDNAREHSRTQLKQIARSIEAFGFNAPILVDANGKVIAGNGRLEALRLLGRTEAPVIRLEHLSPEQARAYAIADNRLTDSSRFNERQLAVQLKALAEIVDLDFNIEATGFTMAEIDVKIESLGDLAPRETGDEAPIEAGPAVARVGDLWVLGKHRLICASALEPESYERLLGADRVHAVFTDAPFNVPVRGHISGKGKRQHREFVEGSGEMSEDAFSAFLGTACRMAAKHSLPGSVHMWVMDWRHVRQLLNVGDEAYDELLNICVWVKNNGGMGSLYRSAHELVAVFRHGRARHRNNVRLGKYGRNRTNVWSFPGANTFLKSSEEGDLMGQHPTPKPLAMVAEAMLDVTARGDLVLDGFVGSGTTLLACERIGRRCRAIDLDPLYIDLTIRRWQRLTGEVAVRQSDGKTFDEVAAAHAEVAS